MRSSTTFTPGHKKVGGFVKGSKHTEESKLLVSASLLGRTGKSARRWLGEGAGYVAKHMWIVKHHGHATKCQNIECAFKNPKRYEWANISKTYKRERTDYIELCPSCHRKWDMGKITIKTKELCVL